MRGLQEVRLLGNLTKDPDIRYTPQKIKVAQFTVAVNKEWKDYETKLKKSRVDYIPVTAWEQLADIAEEYLKKGQLVHIIGELRTIPFSKDNKINILQIKATDIIMIGRPRDTTHATANTEGTTDSAFDTDDPLNIKEEK